MKKLQNILITVSMLVLVSACGTTQKDRALSGAGIGAGVGAGVGAITGGSPWAGAAIGGAVGAAAGGLTKKKDVNLGDPFWR